MTIGKPFSNLLAVVPALVIPETTAIKHPAPNVDVQVATPTAEAVVASAVPIAVPYLHLSTSQCFAFFRWCCKITIPPITMKPKIEKYDNAIFILLLDLQCFLLCSVSFVTAAFLHMGKRMYLIFWGF